MHSENEYYDYDEYDDQYDGQYEYAPAPYKTSEALQKNLIFLRKAILDRNIYEIQNIYENSLTKLIDQSKDPLPPPHAVEVAQLFNEDSTDVFTLIYKELCFRHIYALGKQTINERVEGYQNYVNFFNYILPTEDGPVDLQLPNQWLWEIMDDFIYQFQSFSLFRTRIDKLSHEEAKICAQNPKLWNIHMVLNVLHSLVARSNINQQLAVYSQGGNPDEVAGPFGCQPLYKMLGYFSLIGLLRLHSQLGDYYQAIKVLENLELSKKSLYSRVPACQVATFYYVGFAYMMMRRYDDAIRTFTNVLMYIMRTKPSFQQRQYQMSTISKQTDQMLALLSICMVLHPQRIDDSILGQLKQAHHSAMVAMQQGDLDTFSTQFKFGCPKFISPVSPYNYNLEALDPEKIHQIANAPLEQQLGVFREEVMAQLKIPTIRSFLKLYTTMPVEKLAKFYLQMLPPENELHLLSENELTKHFHRQLISFKHLMNHMTCIDGSSSLEGKFQTSSDMDFFIDKDMIHIADTKIAAKYGDYFIKAYHKYDELYRHIKTLQPPL